MSKVIKVINVMVSNPDKISKVFSGGENQSEFFFVYDKKYKWSISFTHDGVYNLYYYPGDENIETLSIAPPEEYENIAVVPYSADRSANKEARDSFKALYELLKEKAYGIDKVFDDIIASDDIL